MKKKGPTLCAVVFDDVTFIGNNRSWDIGETVANSRMIVLNDATKIVTPEIKNIGKLTGDERIAFAAYLNQVYLAHQNAGNLTQYSGPISFKDACPEDVINITKLEADGVELGQVEVPKELEGYVPENLRFEELKKFNPYPQ